MTTRYQLALAVIGVALAPSLGRAQRRVPPPVPAGPIARTPPLPTSAPERIAWEAPARWHRFDRSWGYPLLLETTVATPSPVPTPYPVPVYYPVPVPTRSSRRAPERPAPPYDPTKARMTIVGGGADGGGGVMRIARIRPDSLQLTWLVPARPVQSATFFLADDTQARLRTHAVDANRPRVTMGLARLPRIPVFAGLTVVFADGSHRTTLVPLESPQP